MSVRSSDRKAGFDKKIKHAVPLQRKRTLRSYYVEGNVENPEICIESLNFHCPDDRDGCSSLHAEKRWQWQILHKNEWHNLLQRQSDLLERSFQIVDKEQVVIPALDPSNSGQHSKELMDLLGEYNWRADFQQMVITQVNGEAIFHLRRLSTPSSGKLKNKYSSDFKWFRHENESWVEFGQCVDIHSDSTTESGLPETTSHEIEKQYQKNQSRYMTVNVLNFKAKLDFFKMELTYKKSKKVISVRRRPKNDDVMYPAVWSHYIMGHVEIPEICTNTIEDKCALGNGCGRLHSDAVWQWQFMHDGVWYNLPRAQRGALERSFLDLWEDNAEIPAINPEVMGFTGVKMLSLLGKSKYLAEFDSMTMLELNRPGTNLKIRRLSTPSTVKSLDESATNFVWFFKNKGQSWEEFGCAEVVSPLTSSYDIEKCYESGKWDTMEVSIADGIFELSFTSMMLKNSNTQEEMKVRRRPECARSGEIHLRTRNQVTLSVASREFCHVRKYLFQSIVSPEIKSIKRVQNPRLWNAFNKRLDEVSSNNGTHEMLNIHTLFQWVDKNLVEDICRNKFKWKHQCKEVKSLCDRSLVFFRSAEFQHTSCPSPTAKDHRLLVFKVFVGKIRTSKGDSHPGECCSEVDNAYIPNWYMKNDKRDYCLEYIIEM
ncbi:uncharacterized protein [Palaemon carinicauda]|uniref:uncharacterized protein n=1 Tax=Palaemon carinicauda TaxID=392227 RepID=UPI0035B5FCDB